TQDAGHARFNISTKNKTESAQEFGRYHWKQDVAQCKNSLTQTIKQGIRTNPIERLTGALAKQGVDMRIRPATFQFVPSRMEQPPERIFAYLDRLESDEPLPPARFINRDGEIIPACQ
ncbi:hypothetical protein, partial [Bifidobacterium adolescentis]|uniref:hypothetical protein n=1 Tax=Bifidobacterium adolescentis TaxID=1680 RepID=UPI001C03380F